MPKITTAGLKELKRDDRDATVGGLFQLPKLAELPADFMLEGYNIKHQENSDFCSQFAACGASELQEGVELSPEWSFAAMKSITGNPDSWGGDLRDACKAHTKMGAVEKAEAPYSLGNKDRTFLVRLENWPSELKTKALKHQKQSYVAVTSIGDDDFDTIRKTIWKWRDEKRAVIIGVVFGWDLSQKIMDVPTEYGTGHAMYCIGWKTIGSTIYAVIVQSYGKDAGDNGTHLFSRSIINKYVPIFGAYTLIDKPWEEIKYMIDNKIKEGDSLLLITPRLIFTAVWKIISSIWLTPKEKIDLIRNATNTMNDIADTIEKK